MGKYRNKTCFVPGCKTGYKTQLPTEKISTFKAPRDILERGKWAKSIPRGDRVLQENDCLRKAFPLGGCYKIYRNK